MSMYKWNLMFQREEEEEKRRERNYNKQKRRRAHLFLLFSPNYHKKRKWGRERTNKHARKCSSTILFRIRLPLKPFIRLISSSFSIWKVKWYGFYSYPFSCRYKITICIKTGLFSGNQLACWSSEVDKTQRIETCETEILFPIWSWRNDYSFQSRIFSNRTDQLMRQKCAENNSSMWRNISTIRSDDQTVIRQYKWKRAIWHAVTIDLFNFAHLS